MSEPHLLNIINDGREIPTQPCQCGSCGGEFFVPQMSTEWWPSYCCYCGIKFVRHDSAGEPAPFHGDPQA